MVLEVKSTLQPGDVQTFSNSLQELAAFERFYEPAEVFKLFAASVQGTVEAFCVRGSERSQGVPAIHGAMFAYEAASNATIESYFSGTTYSPMLACVHVLRRALWVQASPGEWSLPSSTADSFPAFAAFLLKATTDEKDRWTFLRPDVGRYVRSIIEGVDAKVGTPNL